MEKIRWKKWIAVVLSLSMILMLMPSMTVAAASTTSYQTMVSISGINNPKAGYVPDYIPRDYHGYCEIISTDWDGELDSTGHFQSGKEYTVKVTVGIIEKYQTDNQRQFDPKYKVGTSWKDLTINGKQATVSQYSRFRLTISYTYPVLEESSDAGDNGSTVAGDIKSVRISGLLSPDFGKKPDTSCDIDSGSNSMAMEITRVEWIGDLTVDGYYRYSTAYKVRITVSMKEVYRKGHALADSLNTVGKTNKGVVIQDNSHPTVTRWGKYELVMEYTYEATEDVVGEPPATLTLSPFEFDGGDGTVKNPYLISTAKQLNAVRQGLDDHYKLTKDIDLSKWGNWIPIGSNEAYANIRTAYPNKASIGVGTFTGSFDGNGHVIKGMTIKIKSAMPFMSEKQISLSFGLFANISGTGNYKDTFTTGKNRSNDPYNSKRTCNISNLGIVNYNIDVTYTNIEESTDIYAGAITGIAYNCGFYNCYGTGGKIKINLKSNSTRSLLYRDQIGGIAATTSSVDIRNCYNRSPISLQSNKVVDQSFQAGGIVATTAYTWIYNCYNTGKITLPKAGIKGHWTNSVVGGIVSESFIYEIPGIYHSPKKGSTYIWNCYNTGALTAECVAGILVYSASDFYLNNCYNIGKLSGGYKIPYESYTKASKIFNKISGIYKYGKEFVNHVYTDGNKVSGTKWIYSKKLGRKILKAIPEI